MSRLKRSRIRYDPLSAYGLAREGKVAEAIAAFEREFPNPLKNRRLCALYFVVGDEEKLTALVNAAGEHQRAELFGVIDLQFKNSPGHLRIAHYRRNRAREQELYIQLQTLRVARGHEEPLTSSASWSPPISTVSNVEPLASSPPPRSALLTWTVLPAGPPLLNGTLASAVRGHLARRATLRQAERLAYIDGLGPSQWYEGSHLAAIVYYVAVFGRLAIADTAEYGNALYWYSGSEEGWRVVFRRTKREAMRLGARRIVHRGDWKSRVAALVKALNEPASM